MWKINLEKIEEKLRHTSEVILERCTQYDSAYIKNRYLISYITIYFVVNRIYEPAIGHVRGNHLLLQEWIQHLNVSLVK